MDEIIIAAVVCDDRTNFRLSVGALNHCRVHRPLTEKQKSFKGPVLVKNNQHHIIKQTKPYTKGTISSEM